jgi:hypothetical protein
MNIYFEQDTLFIGLDETIDYKITESYAALYKSIETNQFNSLYLDFSKTKFITLPGALYLLMIVYFVINFFKNHKVIETYIFGYSEKILDILLNFGCINSLKSYCNLNLDSELDQRSRSRLSFWDYRVRNINKRLNSIYWPISPIPLKHGNNSDQGLFKFFNNFIDSFKAICQCEMIENWERGTLDYLELNFVKAINELTKNVWDHSDSWGVASIQSNRINKTTFCIFDFGVGFINSYIKRKGPYKRSISEDKRTLDWLLEEGHSSNTGDNHGHGLSVIKKFIEIADGVLLISTDNYIITYSNKTNLKIDVKSYFPGTQIMMNF